MKYLGLFSTLLGNLFCMARKDGTIINLIAILLIVFGFFMVVYVEEIKH